jgi:hypothetical protein
MSGVTAEGEALRAELERAILVHLRGSVELVPAVELRNWERIESPSGSLRASRSAAITSSARGASG